MRRRMRRLADASTSPHRRSGAVAASFYTSLSCARFTHRNAAATLLRLARPTDPFATHSAAASTAATLPADGWILGRRSGDARLCTGTLPFWLGRAYRLAARWRRSLHSTAVITLAPAAVGPRNWTCCAVRRTAAPHWSRDERTWRAVVGHLARNFRRWDAICLIGRSTRSGQQTPLNGL